MNAQRGLQYNYIAAKVLVCSSALRVLLLYFLFPGVYLSLNGEIFHNHSYIAISGIGSSDNNALLCITNRPGTPTTGNWFVPDGTRVSTGGVPGFSRTTGPMVMRLKRNTATDPAAEGIYYCEIKDNTETEQRVYVGIYNGGGMH